MIIFADNIIYIKYISRYLKQMKTLARLKNKYTKKMWLWNQPENRVLQININISIANCKVPRKGL